MKRFLSPSPIKRRKSRLETSELLENRVLLTAAPNQAVGFDMITGEEIVYEDAESIGLSALTSYTDGFAGLAADLNLPSGLQETVHGNDDRDEVSNTLAFPARTAVKLRMTFGSSTFIGSGIMISEFHVLTAGHCVYDDSAGWVSSIEVSPAQDDIDQSNGENGKWYGTANSTYVRSYSGWTDNGLADWDWGLITLDRSIGNYTGWAGAQWWSDNSVFNGLAVETFGYPGDLQGGRDMYHASGPTSYATDLRVYYTGTMDTAGGQSGSGVIHNDGTGNRVVGVHAYGGSTYNSAPRMTQTRFDDLYDWIADDENTRSPNDRPDLVGYDDWFNTDYGNISSTTLSPGSSFTVETPIRNNGTATASSFTVRFYASANNIISTGDTEIGSATVSSLDGISWTWASFSGTLPSLAAGDYHIGYIIDTANSNSEFLEGNNTGYFDNQILTVTPPPADPNDQISEALTAGFGTYTGSISDSSDVDMWAVTVGAGDQVTFALNTPTSDLDPEIRLFNSSGQLLDWDDDDGPDYDSLLTYTFNSAGTYYLGVAVWNNDGYDPITGDGDDGTADGGAYELVITLGSSSSFGSDIFARAGGNWWVANSNGTDAFTNQLWSSWDPNAGWQDVNVADVDGDGDSDVVGRTSSGQWWVGRNTGSSFNTEFWGYWVPSGWQDVQVADVDGDGDDDIVGRDSGGSWWVARSNGSSGFTNELWGGWVESAGWVNVMVADLDGDGDDDIIGQSNNGQWWAARSTGSSFTTQYWGYWVPSGWQDVQVTDVDGDGDDDVVGRDSGGSWWVGRSNGTNFVNELWGGWVESAGWVNVMVTDLDGDGNGDIIGQSNNGQWWAARSTGSSFQTQYWGYWVPSGWQDVQVIDVDQDGNADVVGRNSSGYLWVARSNGSVFNNELWGWMAPSGWNDVMVGNTSPSSSSVLPVIAEDDDEASIFG